MAPRTAPPVIPRALQFAGVPWLPASGFTMQPWLPIPGVPALSWTTVNGIPVPVIPGLTGPGTVVQSRPPPRALTGARRPGCGFVNTGAIEIPLDCASGGWADIPFASRFVVPRDALSLNGGSVGAASLPAIVDHRVDGTEGPVRNQGRVGACTAFSFAAAVDHAVSSRTGTPGWISATHVWARYHTPSMQSAASSNMDKPLALESTWSYTKETEQRACSWVDKGYCKPGCQATTCACSSLPASECGQPVDETVLSRADSAPSARVTDVTRLDKANLKHVQEVLSKGQDVWMSMKVGDALDDDKLLPQHAGLKAVIADFDARNEPSGHAMVLAGYRVQEDGTYFLLHNSWGESWGDKGYAWIHETTLRTNISSAYVVTAESWDPGKQKVPPRNKEPVHCPSGLAPDSITSECVPPCPDGAARSNGVCSNPQDCPAGYVNLIGFCVPSPAPRSGSDVPSGVTYQCASEGCNYIIPFGILGCRLPACMVSCPSPAYHLTTGPQGFSCAE